MSTKTATARAAASWWAQKWNTGEHETGDRGLDEQLQMMSLLSFASSSISEEQEARFIERLTEAIEEQLASGLVEIRVDYDAPVILGEAAMAAPEVLFVGTLSFPVKTQMTITSDEVRVKHGYSGSWTSLEI